MNTIFVLTLSDIIGLSIVGLVVFLLFAAWIADKVFDFKKKFLSTKKKTTTNNN
jgi:hypothetical protein